MNKVNVIQGQGNYVEVHCYSNYWPEFFPQHSPGPKHTRPIVLTDWQGAIVERHPVELLKGFVHSDGCRPSSKVNGTDYPRYEFTNTSSDIKRLFCQACDTLDVHWTLSNRGRGVQVARRADVAFLDQFVGPKA